MKKVLEIFVDDDSKLYGICGTFMMHRPADDNKSVTCLNFTEGTASCIKGIYFPSTAPAEYIYKEDEDEQESTEEAEGEGSDS